MILTSFFATEIVLKTMVFGLKYFVKNLWLDMIVVTVSAINDFSSPKEKYLSLDFIRFWRVIRVIYALIQAAKAPLAHSIEKLEKKSKKIQQDLDAIALKCQIPLSSLRHHNHHHYHHHHNRLLMTMKRRNLFKRAHSSPSVVVNTPAPVAAVTITTPTTSLDSGNSRMIEQHSPTTITSSYSMMNIPVYNNQNNNHNQNNNNDNNTSNNCSRKLSESTDSLNSIFYLPLQSIQNCLHL